MKKNSLMLTLLLFVMGAKAGTTWSDQDWSSEPKSFSWNTETLLEKGNTAISIGDVITVAFTKTTSSSDAQVGLYSEYTDVKNQYFGTSESPSSFSFTISARERDIFRRYGLKIGGNNITVTGVTKSNSVYSGGDNSVWVGSESWCSVPKNVFQDVKAGDRIVVNMSKTGGSSDFEFGYVNGSWVSTPFDASSYTKNDTKAELKVTSDMATTLRANNGIFVNGSGNYTVSSIDLIVENQTLTQTYAPAGGLTFVTNTDFDLPTEYLKGMSAGDKMIVTVTDISGEGDHKISLHENNWDWIDWISSGITATGEIEVIITDQMLLSNKLLPIKIQGSNCKVSQIQFKPAKVNITITSSKYATYSCEQPLDFTGTGVKAYVASAVSTGKVTLSEVTKVPANTGIMVYCETADTYQIPVTESASSVGTNYLVANVSPTSIAASAGSTWNYIFAKNSSDEVGFYKLTAAHILGAHKAYLQTDTDISTSARVALDFDEETTGVNEISSLKADVSGDYYDLMGRKVAQPTRGLYIVNGKKVIIK